MLRAKRRREEEEEMLFYLRLVLWFCLKSALCFFFYHSSSLWPQAVICSLWAVDHLWSLIVCLSLFNMINVKRYEIMLSWSSACVSCRRICGLPAGNIFFNHHEWCMKDLFPVLAFLPVWDGFHPHPPPFPSFFTFLSPSSNLSHILPPSYIPSFILPPPPPPHRLLCSCSGVWRAASFSKLRWIRCHGDQTQITNNGMLIMVITVWRLLQENERILFLCED